MDSSAVKTLEQSTKEELIQKIQQLQSSQKDLEAKHQVDAKLSGFSDVLRFNEEDTLEKWSDRLLENLAETLEALQGSLYITRRSNLEEEEDWLELAGTYAFDKDNLEEKLKFGQGIVGQAAKSQKQYHFTAESSFETRSYTSLAEVRPKSVLVHPLIFNEQVLGVLEVSSLSTFTKNDIRLIEGISETVAANLLTILNQEEMRRLLEDLQNKTQELMAQEEELRQNMEEMQTMKDHQEQLSREFKSQLDAINRSTAVIEFDLEGHILKANDNFLSVVKYELEEVQGKHHQIFVTEEYAQSDEYKEFWTRLRRGEFFTGQYERVDKNGKKVWIQATYNPIHDEDGNPVKIIKYASDITHQMQQQQEMREYLEEVQAQEEELRQNAEEMQAIQENLTDTRKELQAQLDAINRSNAVIEFELDGTILHANENFLNVVKYELDEIVGQHHRMFVRPEYAKSDEYKTFWERLNAGEFFVAEYERIDKHGNPVWIKASYNPILREDGTPYKVIKYATDITELKRLSLTESGVSKN